MNLFLLLSVTVLMLVAAPGFTLKCYVLCSGTEETCIKNKLEGDQATYLKGCSSPLDNVCMRLWFSRPGVTKVQSSCSSLSRCYDACDSLEDKSLVSNCAASCCSSDACNAGSRITISVFLLTVCSVLSLVLMK